MISYTPIIQSLGNSNSSRLDLLRLDLIDTEISGNKWFKLKRNLEKARAQKFETVITLGGAFSNHIAATAAACKRYNLKCTGVIRGEEKDVANSTLSRAEANGMHLHFVSRDFYSQKEEPHFKEYLKKKFGRHYLIPEGGNNEEGVLGCTEIIRPDWDYDYIFCACGTAATYAGLLAGKQKNQKIIGISVLKGENKLPAAAEKMVQALLKNGDLKIMGNEALQKQILQNDCILNFYAFKGYAKPEPLLLAFKKAFEIEHGIPLDHIYTTKLMYAVCDLAKKNKLKAGSKSLIIHSGGMQGNKSFESRYHLIPNL